MTENFFYAPCQAKLSVSFLSSTFHLPDRETFLSELPPLAALSGLTDPLDRSSVKALHKYGREFARLADRQVALAERINQVVSYLVAERSQDMIHRTLMIGGSGFKFSLPPQPRAALGDLVKFTLALAPHCLYISGYGRIAGCEPDPERDGCAVLTAEFALIREEDREAIIQAVTRIQQQELRMRADRRAEENNDTH
ncbi:MAG: PilZ domain-containing protein [Succinivibrionaceae bacterium]|nr:PilZ domain-containing protein [Succinivibrionaceae bacterium]